MGNASVFGGARMTVPSAFKAVVPLNDNDWETIKMAADLGVGANFWAVGDTKEVTLNGTVGALTFSNETYCCFIIGFDHNESREGKGIHFMFGKSALTNGVDISFIDSTWGKHSGVTGFRMNLSESNVGGWKSSHMRNTICPAFLSALPSELQAVISPCTKYTDNTGNASTSAGNVTTTEDSIFLLSEFEIGGSADWANTYEQNYQEYYAYYAAGNSRMKQKHTDPDPSATAGYSQSLRSPYRGDAKSFVWVGTIGGIEYMTAWGGVGFDPCFKVGGAA